jgi:hypothetical protein
MPWRPDDTEQMLTVDGEGRGRLWMRRSGALAGRFEGDKAAGDLG